MASAKKTTKKVTTRKASVNNVDRSKENKKHILAGFLLGLLTATLVFCIYLIVYAVNI